MDDFKVVLLLSSHKLILPLENTSSLGELFRINPLANLLPILRSRAIS